MRAADEIISLNLNIQNTQDIYKEIKTSLLSFIDLRRGFNCVICNANTQDKIMDVMSNDNQIINALYLSKNFCESLVE